MGRGAEGFAPPFVLVRIAERKAPTAIFLEATDRVLYQET